MKITLPDYERQLQSQPLAKRKALIDGRWDAVSGAIYELSDKHVVEPFPIPFSWGMFRSCDDGFRAEAAVLWCAWDRDGTDTVYVIAELYQAGLNRAGTGTQNPEDGRKLSRRCRGRSDLQ